MLEQIQTYIKPEAIIGVDRISSEIIKREPINFRSDK